MSWARLCSGSFMTVCIVLLGSLIRQVPHAVGRVVDPLGCRFSSIVIVMRLVSCAWLMSLRAMLLTALCRS